MKKALYYYPSILTILSEIISMTAELLYCE